MDASIVCRWLLDSGRGICLRCPRGGGNKQCDEWVRRTRANLEAGTRMAEDLLRVFPVDSVVQGRIVQERSLGARSVAPPPPTRTGGVAGFGVRGLGALPDGVKAILDVPPGTSGDANPPHGLAEVVLPYVPKVSLSMSPYSADCISSMRSLV